MNGIEGQEDDYKRRELQPHWVPGGDHESTDERVNGRTGQRTNGPTDERANNEPTNEQANKLQRRSRREHAIIPENSGCWVIHAHKSLSEGT